MDATTKKVADEIKLLVAVGAPINAEDLARTAISAMPDIAELELRVDQLEQALEDILECASNDGQFMQKIAKLALGDSDQ